MIAESLSVEDQRANPLNPEDSMRAAWGLSAGAKSVELARNLQLLDAGGPVSMSVTTTALFVPPASQRDL